MTTADTIHQWDRDCVWHPFTQMQDWMQDDQIIIERGEGVYLTDTRGRRYIDGTSSMWTNVHGHNIQPLNDAITEQLGRIAHSTLLGQSNVPAATLARRLVDLAPPGLNHVFYSDNGSTAMEVAVKMAFQYWQHKGQPERTSFIKLDHAYHGDTLGTVAVGGVDLFHATFGSLLFQTHKAHSPFPYHCPASQDPDECRDWALQHMRSLLQEHHKHIAAVVMEPLLQGAGGMIVHPAGYLKGVRDLCNEFDTLLILDEIMTGFGRCGSQWASTQEDIIPDIFATAKGLTAGYLPLSATLCTDEIFSTFLGHYDEFKTFFHGHTFTGNQLGCAVGLANLDLYESSNLLARIRETCTVFAEGLRRFTDLEHVGDTRHCGMAAGLELVRDRDTKDPYAVEEQYGIRVCKAATEKGLILRPLGNTIVLMPILAIDHDSLERMLDITRQAIIEVTM